MTREAFYHGIILVMAAFDLPKVVIVFIYVANAQIIIGITPIHLVGVPL